MSAKSIDEVIPVVGVVGAVDSTNECRIDSKILVQGVDNQGIDLTLGTGLSDSQLILDG